MSYKKDAPVNFSAGALGAGVAGLKGLFDKDLKGQGFGARLKNAGAAVGNELLGTDVFQTQDMQAAAAGKSVPQESGMGGIHSKLDKLLQISGQGEDDKTDGYIAQPQAPQQLNTSALSMKANAFMGTPQQSPHSNGTGGKNPTFKEDTALRMMAVADPNTSTSGLMFTDPGDKFKLFKKAKVKATSEDPVSHKEKSSIGFESSKINVGNTGKVGFSAGVDRQTSEKYGAKNTPSASVKFSFNPTKLYEKAQKKKQTPKHNW